MKQKKEQNKDWLDWWLSDDAPTPEMEAKLRAPQLPDAEPAATNITVKVPKIKPVMLQAEITKVAVFAVCMMLAGLAAHTFIFKSPAQPVSASGQQVLAAGVQAGQSSVNSISIPTGSNGIDGSQSGATTPFTPVIPTTTSPSAQNYNAGTGVYSYQDSIMGNTLAISEQPIPAIYKNSSDGLSKIAASVNADKQVDTNNGKAYIYTNPTSGQQTVVFFMNTLYIYINSNITHSSDVWKAYINTLK